MVSGGDVHGELPLRRPWAFEERLDAIQLAIGDGLLAVYNSVVLYNPSLHSVMPNLTQKLQLVRQLAGPASDPRHYLIAFESTSAGLRLHSCLKPGRPFGNPFLRPVASFHFYSVPAESLLFRYQRRYWIDDKRDTTTLSVDIHYLISSPHIFVDQLSTDPLRKLVAEIESFIKSKAIAFRPLLFRPLAFLAQTLSFSYNSAKKQALAPEFTALQRFAGHLGLEILDIKVTTKKGADEASAPVSRYPLEIRGSVETAPHSEAVQTALHTLAQVLISHQIPTTIHPGNSFPVEIIFHLSTIEPLASEDQKIEEASAIHIATGTELLITLIPPEGFKIDEPDGVITWAPPRARIQFMLTAPAAIKEGGYWAKAKVRTLRDPGIALCRFYIQLQVGRDSVQTPLTTKIQTVNRLPRTAFASYARKDTAIVMHRVAALDSIGVDVFVDCLDIREGADWEAALNSHTISKDTFLLFWSRNASASTWVDREWRHALRERGLSYITPNALEPPDVSPPPTELASLQFGSVPLLLARSSEKPAAPPSAPEACSPSVEA